MSTPSFRDTLQLLLDAIHNKNMEAYRSCITSDKTLYTIVQNGHAFTTSQELLAMHEAWFQDDQWIWKGEIEHVIEGSDLAMALIKYNYQNTKEEEPIATWLTYVFRLEDGQWKLVHDHNTSLDFPAFAKAAGLA